MSTFQSKKSEALRILGATGIRPLNYLPPATKALWRLGFEVRPPHFVSFGKVMLSFGTYFAITWGAIVYSLSLFGIGAPVASLTAFALGCGSAGLCFGLATATYYAYGRRKHHLPSWETLGENEGAA
jgi:hypothetical protein